jgi:hypothetical protein
MIRGQKRSNGNWEDHLGGFVSSCTIFVVLSLTCLERFRNVEDDGREDQKWEGGCALDTDLIYPLLATVCFSRRVFFFSFPNTMILNCLCVHVHGVLPCSAESRGGKCLGKCR